MNPATVTASRALSLRAPIVTEQERALFQRRLVLTLYVVFILAIGFWLLQLVTITVVANGKLMAFFARTPIQLTVTFSALIAAVYLQRTKPSKSVLDVADAVMTIGICTGWAVMISREHDPGDSGVRSELIALLASSYTLATRAALVPSTSARSALLGIGAIAPLVPITYFLQSRTGPDSLAIGPTVYVGIWGAVGVACTTTISSVIYGLRQEVRKAMQLGQYMLEDKIGEGGMGVVYRASHAMLRRPTAIKLLSGGSGQAAERFEREVQITARLTHPNTVAVFDYGRTPDGVFYYAMEYLDGITLDELVTDFGPQSAERVVHILVQMCGALVEAHTNGLVHRDIKPANVMLTERGCVPDVVKVLDFGLVMETAQDNPGGSDPHAILGTPHYMAPEAIVDPSKVDARTDLYAVGATAYFLLTGDHVFDGTTLVEVCSQHLHDAPVPPRAKRADVPESLEKVVLACLAKKPEDRPADAAALVQLLLHCEVAEWTPEDARAWWELPAAKKKNEERMKLRSGIVAAKKSETINTMAIDLDDRGAA